ncbi:gamma-glutamyltransferase [Exilibacterium tricleocarpae]|uniref:Gamma-glutamyltransferase n=1 Tax=Exilibacterium tricleocarpae TaxID=2591008 RepID=A0A545SZX2_9GAMM|nr:gamma-glutamyltransferase [Exilibacterium tricleocarpae]TQV70524.1 gamma-glutamyltransferase [Exilibacterium tricleocarpae]
MTGINRRDFINLSAIGAVAGLSGCVSTSGASTAASTGALASAGWKPPSDPERRRLVAMAEFGRKQGVSGRNGVAVCTHPLATKAATDMLQMGGNAVDAICAASMAQAVVEPHMTTLSGVFSMLYYEAATGRLSYVNGSANAPKKHPIFTLPLSDLGRFIATGARTGALCPVPGFWGGFEAAHDHHGRLSRKTVMAPAIHYARDGFEIHPFLWGEMFVESAALGAASQGQEMYFKNRRLLNTGEKLIQSRHADTLERLAEEGSDYFYRGEFARKYVQAVQAAGGYVTEEDMAQWQPLWDQPVRTTYRDYELVAAPTPDFGGQALVEIMNMVEHIDLQRQGPAFESPETTFKLMQIVGQVYTDSILGRLTGTLMPVEKAISKEFAAERFAKLSGPPKGPYDNLVALPPGSNHVTVVDGEGNIATVLHSVMSMPYTTGIFVEGVYACAGLIHLGAGIPGPDRRIHARICPNMFFKNGKPVLASGSPSVSLTENIVQNSINILDFGLDIETSVHKARFGGANIDNLKMLMVEADMGAKTLSYLRGKNAAIKSVNPWNWTHGSFDGIHIDAQGLASACGDPRRTAQAFAV